MNKKLIALIAIVILLIGSLTCVVVKKSTEKIIQGEVDTKTVDLSSKLTGRVMKLHVKKGDMVKKGDLLITLDTPEIKAKETQSDASVELALAQEEKAFNGARSEEKAIAYNTMIQAQAGLDLAKKTYKRMENLHREGVVPTQKLDEIRAHYKSAQESARSASQAYKMYQSTRSEDKKSAVANVKRARGAQQEVQSYLRENKIVSPIDGQITEISVEEGELVGAGYPIVTVVSVDDNWLVFNLREDYLQKIRIGKTFMATIPAISNKPIEVKVNYISALGSYATWRATKIRGDFDLKTFEVRATPVNKMPDLKAGMTAVVEWNKVK